jgi:hypothetical protein
MEETLVHFVSLKVLHTVWFQMCDTLRKAELWRQEEISAGLGEGSRQSTEELQGSEAVLYEGCGVTRVVECLPSKYKALPKTPELPCMLTHSEYVSWYVCQIHRTCSIKGDPVHTADIR